MFPGSRNLNLKSKFSNKKWPSQNVGPTLSKMTSLLRELVLMGFRGQGIQIRDRNFQKQNDGLNMADRLYQK